MSRKSPTVRGNTLSWHDKELQHQICVGTVAWYNWLEHASTFTFVSDLCLFTAHKEVRKASRAYWKAYRKHGGKLYRAYLGKSEHITLERMNTVAAFLSRTHSSENFSVENHDATKIIDHQVDVLEDNSLLTRDWQTHKDGSKGNNDKNVFSPSSIPFPLTSLIGRQQEVTTLRNLLSNHTVRLLTLTGPGGVGKTRLSLEVANLVQNFFPDGICFVPLSSLQEHTSMLLSITQALNLQTYSMTTLLDLLKTTLSRRQFLLILDNFEHVIKAAPLLTDLLTACPQLKIVVTSRERLHIRGERIFPVTPLTLPDLAQSEGCATITQYGAIALFIERAKEIYPSFQLSKENAPYIIDICCQLDGLPLSIELATARLNLFSLPVLKEKLKHRFLILTDGPRDAPPRHQTLRNTLTWSYNLLSQEEKKLFHLLAVFVGGCTLQDVESLYRTLYGNRTSVIDLVSSLCDKHLLFTKKQKQFEPRLEMLETVREYGWECLLTSGELEQARHEHAFYYLHLIEEIEPHLYSAAHLHYFYQLEQERGNLLAALKWAVEQGTKQQEVALRLIGAARWRLREGYPWLKYALKSNHSITIPIWTKALFSAGCLAFLQDDGDQAEKCFKQHLLLCREARDKRGEASSLHWLGWLLLITQHDYLGAQSLLEESITIAKNTGDRETLAFDFYSLGYMALEQKDYPRGYSLLEESQMLFKQIGNKKYASWAMRSLGRVLFTLNEQERAYSLVEESLLFSNEICDQLGSAYALNLKGRFALIQKNISAARSALEESLSLFTTLGYQRQRAYTLCLRAKLALLQSNETAACDFYKESCKLFQQTDDLQGLAYLLQEWGILMAIHGNLLKAACCWGMAETLTRMRDLRRFSLPIEQTVEEVKHYEHMIAVVQAKLHPSVFVKTWEEGRTATLEQILEEQGLPIIADQSFTQSYQDIKIRFQKKSVDNISYGLTKREIEVLHLVAQGLTDAKIAELLSISPRTVNSHLRNTYSKLGITSRYAAIQYVLKNDLA